MMRRYCAIKIAVVNPGALISLNQTQADARSMSVTSRGEGLWLVDKSIQFKAGEEVGLEELTPRELDAGIWQPLESKKPSAKTKAS